MGVNDQINPTLEKNQNIKKSDAFMWRGGDVPGKHGMRVKKLKQQGDQKCPSLS